MYDIIEYLLKKKKMLAFVSIWKGFTNVKLKLINVAKSRTKVSFEALQPMWDNKQTL